MFICNLKINSRKLWIYILIILAILISTLLILSGFKIFNNTSNNNLSLNYTEIPSTQYTNFLKNCNENLDNYIGQKIKISGYVYRLPNFSSTQFVLARTMIIDNDMDSVVVGILCECHSASKYSSGSWIEVCGTIKKGNYNGEIPVLEISDISSITAPNDEFVYLPTE